MALRFLLVDDSAEVTKVMALTLRVLDSGAETRTATSSEEAFHILVDFTPNLITTDINRILENGGFESGYDFLTQLRSNPRTKFIPVVAVSATSEKAEEELRQYRHGFNAVLPKPFTPQELIERVRRVLELSVDSDIAVFHLGFEHQGLDYKEFVDLSSKNERAALAKDVIAMANWGGGTLIIGVAETTPGEFVPVGVPEQLLEVFETSRLNRALRDYLDPPVPIKARRVRDGHQVFVFLEIPPATSSLVLAKRKNEHAGLYPGRIYTRTSAAESAEVQDSTELRDLLERLLARRNKL